NVTLSPRLSALVMLSTTASTAREASALLRLASLATASIRSDLFILCVPSGSDNGGLPAFSEQSKRDRPARWRERLLAWPDFRLQTKPCGCLYQVSIDSVNTDSGQTGRIRPSWHKP